MKIYTLVVIKVLIALLVFIQEVIMARKNIKKGLSTLLVTVSLLSLVGCGGQKTLDGHYTVDTPTYNFPKTLNFESDGDCDYNDTLGITYKIEDGRLRF